MATFLPPAFCSTNARELMTHWTRRVAGLAILLLTIVPVYRQLPVRSTGLLGRYVAEVVDLQASLLWSGFLVLLLVAAVAGLFLRPALVFRFEGTVARAIMRPSLPLFAAVVGVVAAGLTALVAVHVFERRPNLVDALVQLTHARYAAAGQLGGPAVFTEGFWHIQNAVMTEAGWFSQYPPGHIALLAVGFLARAEWLVGPLVMGATAAVSVLAMQRLLPGREAVARAAGLAAGLSPFLMAHSAAFMNHSTAALLGVLSVYCALRARDGASEWAAGTGAAVAALAAVRPMAGIVAMIVVAAGVWLPTRASGGSAATVSLRSRLGRLPKLGALALIGGLPFVAGHLWYNRVAFGGFTVFGYDATWGSAHGFGFHRDPWGNAYGPVEALLYTSADLTALNLNLLEALLPLVSFAGLHLLVARTLEPGERVLALWSLLPVLTNALYWHHGYFMGPRMLAEFAPPWSGLAVVSVYGLLRRVPDDALLRGRFSPRVAGSALVIAGVAASLVMGAQRLSSYGGPWRASFRAPVPAAPANSVVFIYGGWEARLISRLAAEGIGLNSVETAMRQNPTCLVQRHLDARLSGGHAFGAGREGGDPLPPLDLVPGAHEFLPRPEIAPGAQVRMTPGEALPEACLRQLRADRFGAMDASYFFWLGDLPGIEEGKPLFARDLGPEVNQRLLAGYPDRSAWMYGYFTEGDSLRLLPYAEGIARLWGGR